jgi:uncharacterized protein DUF6745
MSEPKKLDKLTSEQEALMPVVRDEWINLTLNSGKAVQEHEIREGIDWLYKISRLPEHPRIVIVDSNIRMPLADMIRSPGDLLMTTRNSRRDSKYRSMNDYVLDSITRSLNFILHSLQKSARNSVHDSIWNSAMNSVLNSVHRSVWTEVYQPATNSKIIRQLLFQELHHSSHREDFIVYFLGLANWAGYLSFFDYFRRIGVINDDKNFNMFRDMIRAGIWAPCYYEHRVLVCRLPTKVSKDEQGRLHCITGPAVQWRDGLDQYFLHGVDFGQNLHNDMSEPELWKNVVSKNLSFKEIVEISNIEQRYAVLKLYGAEKLLQEAGAQRIDKSKRGNELYKIENLILGRALKLLKYKDPSTDRIYVSFVPYQYEKADAAMAWKFQLSEGEYKLLKIEA